MILNLNKQRDVETNIYVPDKCKCFYSTILNLNVQCIQFINYSITTGCM